MVVGTVGTEKTGIPAPIDRRDIPPEEERLQVTLVPLQKPPHFDRTWYGKMGVKWETMTVDAKKQAILESAKYNAPTTPPIFPTATKTSTGGSMDLGSIITDLGKAYITTKYAPSTSAPLPTVQPAYSLPEMAGDITDFFMGEDGTIVPVKKKRCRRRRRRLATKSDLGDLAALKAILGNGEAFKAWIATHSR